MAQKIESDKLLVKDVFSKWYRIPEYQRPYVWGTDQVTELLDDVFLARNSNPQSQYFLGSMVLKKTEKEDGNMKYEEYDLLDGQQRVTTLFLLTAVIRDLTPASNAPRIKTCTETVYQMANPDDNVPERIRIVFDIRDKVRDFVDQYVKPLNGTTTNREVLTEIREKKDEDISIRNMANAILVMQDYFEEKSIDDFFPYLRSNVLMIYVAAEELEDAFHLFTVMNNRGIKLRNSDILKAENLRAVKDEAKQKVYAKQWEEIEEYHGEDFDNFLSHLRTILVKQKAGYNLLKEFEENIYAPKEYDRNSKKYNLKLALLKKGESTFKFIGMYHQHYKTLFESDLYDVSGSYELFNHLKLMEVGFEADLWVAPLLRYYDKFRTNKLIDFVKALEHKFASDWLIGLTPTSRIESVNAIIQKTDDSDNPYDILNSAELAVDKKELLEIFKGNIYGRRAAKYVLLKLDLIFLGYSTPFKLPPTISIEHILPQNPDVKSRWLIDFTEEERGEWLNKLGNLVLISRRKNTAQSNRDYADKKERYFKNNIELFSNSVRIYQQYPTWTINDLKHNHNVVLNKLLVAFQIPNIVTLGAM